MSRPVPQPPYARASMHFEAWAGHPAVRTGRRLIGRGAPRRVRAPHDTRPLMLRRLVLLAFVVLGAEPKLDAVVTVDSNAELRERNLYRNQVSGAWRMTVRVKRADASKPVEMRAFISQDGKSLSETWSYILPSESEKP